MPSFSPSTKADIFPNLQVSKTFENLNLDQATIYGSKLRTIIFAEKLRDRSRILQLKTSYNTDSLDKVLGCVQTGATTPNIVAPTMLEVVACVLAVVCKRMQQLPTSLGPAMHRRKNTSHKSL